MYLKRRSPEAPSTDVSSWDRRPLSPCYPLRRWRKARIKRLAVASSSRPTSAESYKLINIGIRLIGGVGNYKAIKTLIVLQ